MTTHCSVLKVSNREKPLEEHSINGNSMCQVCKAKVSLACLESREVASVAQQGVAWLERNLETK